MSKVVAKLQRKKKLIKEEAVFKSLSNNKTPAEFTKYLQELDTASSVKTIIENNKLIEYLDEKAIDQRLIIISKEDRVKKAMTKIKKKFKFTQAQFNYLKKIEKYMAN